MDLACTKENRSLFFLLQPLHTDLLADALGLGEMQLCLPHLFYAHLQAVFPSMGTVASHGIFKEAGGHFPCLCFVLLC